jgi:hypothetical protein
MIRRDTAKRLCTDREFELVEASMPAHVRQLTPSALRQKIERARKLRDKYRDLAKRQRLEARGKRRPSGTRPAQGNENTERKAEIFDEVLDRFQAASKQPPATTASAKQSAAKASPERKSAGKKSAGRKSAGKKSVGVGKKSAAKKSAAKKSAGKKAATNNAAVKKSAAPESSQTNPRQRQDAAMASRAKTQRAHGRAAQGRSQSRRDNRGR